GDAPRLFHQVHETEVPRAEHDHLAVRDLVLRAIACRRWATGGLAQGMTDGRVVLVTAGQSRYGAALERALDELVKAVAVALLEGGALGLPVIGEDDELVGPRCMAARARDTPEVLVELEQGFHRVGALEPGVVCDLVVA